MSTQPAPIGTSFAVYRQNVGDPPAYFEYNLMKEHFLRELKKRPDSRHRDITAINTQLVDILQRNGGNLRQKDLGAAADIADVNHLLQTYTVKYANPEFIGLELFPVMPTEQEGGVYLEYIRGPEFDVKRRPGGSGNDVSSSENHGYITKRVSYTVVSDSETGKVGKDRILTPNTPINEMFNLRERVDHAIAFRREVKIRDLITDSANYSSANYLDLTPGIRWDEPGGDPGQDILTALATIWRGEGSSRLVAWTSLEVWNKIRTSAALLRLLPLTHQGYVTAEQFLQIFGLDGLLVSETRYNTANIAETPSFARLWGKNFGLMRVSTSPQLRNASFGWTYRWMPGSLPMGVESNLWYDPRIGDFGSFFYKVAFKEQPVIVAKDTGYLWTNVIN